MDNFKLKSTFLTEGSFFNFACSKFLLSITIDAVLATQRYSRQVC